MDSLVHRDTDSIKEAVADWPDYFEYYRQNDEGIIRAKVAEDTLICHFTPMMEVALVMNRVPLPPQANEVAKRQQDNTSIHGIIKHQRERLQRLDYLEKEVNSLTTMLRAIQVSPDTTSGQLTVQRIHVGWNITKEHDTVDFHISVLKEIEPILQRLKEAREAELRNLYASFQ